MTRLAYLGITDVEWTRRRKLTSTLDSYPARSPADESTQTDERTRHRYARWLTSTLDS